LPLHFRERLQKRQLETRSALCVGLDPDMDAIPERYRKIDAHLSVTSWMMEVVDMTAPVASMYKLQRAHYEALVRGEHAMRSIISYIRARHPDIPIFVDAKRGDIDRTQRKYRSAIFGADGADGTNVSCYMGSTPFLNMFDKDHPERAIVNLVYTSNPDAREIQEALMENGDPLWLFMARKTLEWAEKCGAENVGFVMAAAYESGGIIYNDHLRRCRELDQGRVWYLMPGFGTQGGFVEASVAAAWTGWGSVAMSASSSISNADDMKAAAEKLHSQIAAAIAAL
jgi:orotidine-5'-phosphate decarboxylase